MEVLGELKELLGRHAVEGRFETAIPRLSLCRFEARTMPRPVLYEPVLVVSVQGRTRLTIGDTVLTSDAGKYLIISVDLPVLGEISEASRAVPCLAISLRIDRAALTSILLGMPALRTNVPSSSAMGVSPVTNELLDAVVRLVRLLDNPADIATLAPLIEREILYRLLVGAQGAMLRQVALAESPLSRISRAIEWIRQHYTEPFRVESVAALVGMSPSSFHRHFKAATAMSPLQYQKQIRLQEARLLLLGERTGAGHVGFAVGYESPSQFSREYSRLFGAPPRRDAARLREKEAMNWPFDGPGNALLPATLNGTVRSV